MEKERNFSNHKKWNRSQLKAAKKCKFFFLFHGQKRMLINNFNGIFFIALAEHLSSPAAVPFQSVCLCVKIWECEIDKNFSTLRPEKFSVFFPFMKKKKGKNLGNLLIGFQLHHLQFLLSCSGRGYTIIIKQQQHHCIECDKHNTKFH
jgi:hypothetical protein